MVQSLDRMMAVTIHDAQCCFVHETGERCPQVGRFWIGRTFLDYSYGCGDHAEDLRGANDTVIDMSNGNVIEKRSA